MTTSVQQLETALAVVKELRDLAREADGKPTLRGDYIVFQLRLGEALDRADAVLGDGGRRPVGATLGVPTLESTHEP